MNSFSLCLSRLGLFNLVSFSTCLLCTIVVAQRKPAEPVNLIYDSHIEGLEATVQEAFIYSGRVEGGLYIPAVIAKPEGQGPFPVFIMVHGSPGGRGISDLKNGLKNNTFVSNRFLKEGYVVVRCSYRYRKSGENEPAGRDVASVIRFVKTLPEVDADKVCLYGTSRGAENSVLAIAEEPVAGAIINDSGARTYMGFIEGAEWPEDMEKITIIPTHTYEKAVPLSYFEKIDSPTLFTASTSRNGVYVRLSNTAIELLTELGKESSVKIYPGERHGFNFGNQKDGPSAGALLALEDAVAFLNSKTR